MKDAHECLHRGFLGADGEPVSLGCIFFCVCPTIDHPGLIFFFFFLNISAVFPVTEQSAPPTGPLPRLQATEVSWVLMGSLVPLFIGGTDAEAEAPILWPPDVKS